jgi:hypothetical protein
MSTPLGQVLTLGNETLMNRAGEQGDAVPADLVAEVLAGDADRPSAGWFENIPLQVIPLFWVVQSGSGGHSSKARTPVLVGVGDEVKESIETLVAKEVATSRKRQYPAQKTQQDPMKRLLLVALTAVTLLSSTTASAHHDGEHKHQDTTTLQGGRK